MFEIIKNLDCPKCGGSMYWISHTSMTVGCLRDQRHRKRVKIVGGVLVFRANGGPKNKVRKTWRINGTTYASIGQHLAEHGVGGQAIIDAGIAAFLEKFPVA